MRKQAELQQLIDQHGPEIDRRREVTPEVVDALVANDMLRLLLPRSPTRNELATSRSLVDAPFAFGATDPHLACQSCCLAKRCSDERPRGESLHT